MFIYHIFIVKEFNKQIRELSKLIRAKDLTEYTISENNKYKKENVMEKEVISDLALADDIEPELFDKMISNQRDIS